MRPRFQADADLNHKIVAGLKRREAAVDIQDARVGGVIGVRDPEVLAKAAESGRILISHDRKTMVAHFVRFIESRSSPGLIVVPQDLDIGSAIEDLLVVWAGSESEEWLDRVGYLPL
jgi:Domain of unknown function (DUF5615)